MIFEWRGLRLCSRTHTCIIHLRQLRNNGALSYILFVVCLILGPARPQPSIGALGNRHTPRKITPSPESYMICGYSSKLGFVLSEFDQYVAPKSTVLLLPGEISISSDALNTELSLVLFFCCLRLGFLLFRLLFLFMVLLFLCYVLCWFCAISASECIESF